MGFGTPEEALDEREDERGSEERRSEQRDRFLLILLGHDVHAETLDLVAQDVEDDGHAGLEHVGI